MKEYIYQVSFREQPLADDVRTDFYFYSLAAIYEVFTPEQVGCTVRTLWNAGIEVGKPYYNRLCSVKKEPISRKPQKRASRTTKISD
ncbi:MAG: hypothetical protein IKU22_08825 [Alistipes sp.]|nr:hypothetical protein [Alistipes sp.]